MIWQPTQERVLPGRWAMFFRVPMEAQTMVATGELTGVSAEGHPGEEAGEEGVAGDTCRTSYAFRSALHAPDLPALEGGLAFAACAQSLFCEFEDPVV